MLYEATNCDESATLITCPSFLQDNQVVCWMTATTPTTHQIIRDNIHRCVHIQETKKGPRYCPSLEAKVTRFPDKSSHNVWLEPEGYGSDLIYPNGLSCSLPEGVQESMYRSVPGLENAKLVRPAYGVEYDHIDARELGPTLETKRIKVCIPSITLNISRSDAPCRVCSSPARSTARQGTKRPPGKVSSRGSTPACPPSTGRRSSSRVRKGIVG